MLCDWLEKSGKVREFCFGRPVGTLLTDLHKIWHQWLSRGRHKYRKWHVNRFRAVTPTKGEMLMVCALFVHSLQQLNRWTDFDDSYLKTRVPATVAFLWALEQRYQFQGIKIPQNCQKLAPIGIFLPKCQNLITAISPKQ